jgi:cytochrome c553
VARAVGFIGIYIEKCAFCHGPDGHGNGASAPSMIPRPRDFTTGMFEYKTTPDDGVKKGGAEPRAQAQKAALSIC